MWEIEELVKNMKMQEKNNKTENIEEYWEGVPVNTEIHLHLIFHKALYSNATRGRSQKTS